MLYLNRAGSFRTIQWNSTKPRPDQELEIFLRETTGLAVEAV